MPPDQLTAEPTELLRTMIRNACVNDDTVGSGQEIRNVAALEDYFAGSGLTCRRFEAAPGSGEPRGADRGSGPDGPDAAPHGAHRRRPRQSRRLAPGSLRRRSWSTASSGDAARPTC